MSEDFDWKTDCAPMLEKAKINFHTGIVEWIPVKPSVALHFLECVPPYDHNGGSFATGEAYTHDAAGTPVYLCFRGLVITGLREEPVNQVVCRLRAVPDETKMSHACYMTRPQFREALRERAWLTGIPIKATV
jgi:hypothetical protein